MAVEVEVKLPVCDRTGLIAKLNGCGFKRGKSVFESDTYYLAEHHDFVKLDEALRVRTVIDRDSGEEKAFITFKGSKMDSQTASRTELETYVADGKVMQIILERIGFTAVLPLEKERVHYLRDDVTVCADEVAGLGCYMEIEVIAADESEKEAAVKKVADVIVELGMKESDVITDSYLEMLVKKAAV